MNFRYIALFVLGVLLLASSSLSHATATDYALVWGRIYLAGDYSSGVSGADITITCLENSNSVSAVSGANGNYLVGLYCPVNTAVEVTAQKEGMSGTETATIQFLIGLPGSGEVDIGVAHVDVSIPEFPSAAAPVLLSLVSFGVVSAAVRKF